MFWIVQVEMIPIAVAEFTLFCIFTLIFIPLDLA